MKHSLVWLLAAAPCMLAAPPSAPEILNQVAQTYKGLQAYQFVATQTTEILARGMRQSAEMHLALAAVKPGKYRLTFKDDSKEIILVADGETTWTYLPKQKQYTKQQAAMSGDDDESDSEQPDTLTTALRALVLFYEGVAQYGPSANFAKDEKVKVGGDRIDCYVVRFQSAKSQHQLWIDKERFIVVRHLELARQAVNGTLVDIHLTINWKEAEIKLPPANDLFIFDPPSNATEVQALNLPGERVLLTGKNAMDFELKDIQGAQVRLSDYRGKIVLLDFWATWCPPCRKELPSIEKLHRQFADKDVVVLGINDEDSGTVKGFLKKNEYTIPTLMDSKKNVHRMYGARAIPTVIVIDRNGVIRAHYIGGRSEADLLAALKTAGL
ncbi:MAG TPA: redoxin domain-containing protein [Bryobacteraceae bacterium]